MTETSSERLVKFFPASFANKRSPLEIRVVSDDNKRNFMVEVVTKDIFLVRDQIYYPFETADREARRLKEELEKRGYVIEAFKV